MRQDFYGKVEYALFGKGAAVLCGTSGVYRVDDIGPLGHLKGYDPNKVYYKLVSIRTGAISYIPVDGPMFLRSVLSKEEASSLLEEAEQIEPEVFKPQGPYELKLYCKSVLEEHDCRRLIAMLKGIEVKTRTGYYRGRKISTSEYDYKKKAEMLLVEELSAALEISIKEARQRVICAVR